MSTNTELFDAPGRGSMYKYPSMTKTMTGGGESETKQTFILHVEAGAFTDSEIVVMLGKC